VSRGERREDAEKKLKIVQIKLKSFIQKNGISILFRTILIFRSASSLRSLRDTSEFFSGSTPTTAMDGGSAGNAGAVFSTPG
jgi:hypothetical protein